LQSQTVYDHCFDVRPASPANTDYYGSHLQCFDRPLGRMDPGRCLWARLIQAVGLENQQSRFASP